MKMGTEFWTGHVTAAKLQGGSANIYAKRHGISVTALYYWRRKLMAAPVMGESGQTNKFMTLRVADAVVSHRSPNCTLVMPERMRLKMWRCQRRIGWWPLGVPHRERADASWLSHRAGVFVPRADRFS